MNQKQVTKMVLTACFAALTFIATYIIKVPTVGTNGYVNIGDTMVLLSAWMIGGVYGGLAAGIGSALSDLIAGYGVYVPGTFVIKMLMAVVAYWIFKMLKKADVNKTIAYISSGIIAELMMVFGYFLYESTLLGYGLGAVPSIGSNFVQAGTCLALGFIVICILENFKAIAIIKKYV